MTPLTWVAVGALGGLGAFLRFVLDGTISSRTSGSLPWGTLVINVSGSFALGLLTGAWLPGPGLFLAGTATLGSYTTFSTWLLESHKLGEDGQRSRLALNLSVSLLAGLLAAALGRLIGDAL